MPWVSIVMMLLSFLLSKSRGASTGQAAAIGAAAGLATYYLADPANPDNLLKIGVDAKDTPGSLSGDTAKALPATGGGNTGLGGVVQTGISEVGKTLQTWGPTGTLAVVGGTTALSAIKKERWLWIVGGAAAFLLLKD